MDEVTFDEPLIGKKKSNMPFILLCAVVVVLIALIFFYLFYGCAIVDGQSMENTLKNGQRCLLQKRGYTIERGDIVTLEHPNPKEKGKMLIKRVIALGGDKILYVLNEGNKYVDMYICRSGEINFKLANEKYLKEERMTYADKDSKFIDMNGNAVPVIMHRSQEVIESIDVTDEHADYNTRLILDGAITVPDGYIYYMGDNRNHSSDARYYGPCKSSAVSGKIVEIAEKGGVLEGFLNFMFTTFNQKV